MTYEIVIYSVIFILSVITLILTIKNSKDNSGSNGADMVVMLIFNEFIRELSEVIPEQQIITHLTNAAKRQANRGIIRIDAKAEQQNKDTYRLFAEMLYKDIIQSGSEETNAGNTSN